MVQLWKIKERESCKVCLDLEWIKVRKDDTSQVIKIDHVSVLSEYFPNATIV